MEYLVTKALLLKIYKHWQSLMLAVSVYWKQILTGTDPTCTQTFLQGNERHGNMQQHHSRGLTWNHHQTASLVAH
jgi:hypothetical protein